jgi:hypothetical protein
MVMIARRLPSEIASHPARRWRHLATVAIADEERVAAARDDEVLGVTKKPTTSPAARELRAAQSAQSHIEDAAVVVKVTSTCLPSGASQGQDRPPVSSGEAREAAHLDIGVHVHDAHARRLSSRDHEAAVV